MNGRITEIVNKAGIRDVGFCNFETVSGQMLNCRALSRLPENAKSIILMLFPYKVKEDKPKNISRYAAVPDYHKIAGKYLETITVRLKNEFIDNKFEWFTDNSPIPEVYAAAAAGLGLYGENGLLINEKYGSWCFIGEIVTDMPLDCKNEVKKCPLCGNCKKACPRGDLGDKCLSAVSQQKKELNFAEKTALKRYNTVWGCDICAEVCPLNKNAGITYIKEFKEAYRDFYKSGEDIKDRAYEWRGESTVKRNFEVLKGDLFS